MVVLAVVVLARIGFGYQFQTVASLGPLLIRRFGRDYAGLGTLIGFYMAAGMVIALPLGRRFGDRLVLDGLVPASGRVGAIAAGARPGRDRRGPAVDA